MCSATVVWLTPGGEENRHPQVRGRLKVNLVDSYTILADGLESGEGFLDDRPCQRIVAAKVGVELSGQRKHLRLGQRAALPDYLEAGLGQQVMVHAWRVLEGCRGQEDSGHVG